MSVATDLHVATSQARKLARAKLCVRYSRARPTQENESACAIARVYMRARHALETMCVSRATRVRSREWERLCRSSARAYTKTSVYAYASRVRGGMRVCAMHRRPLGSALLARPSEGSRGTRASRTIPKRQNARRSKRLGQHSQTQCTHVNPPTHYAPRSTGRLAHVHERVRVLYIHRAIGVHTVLVERSANTILCMAGGRPDCGAPPRTKNRESY